MFAAIVLTVFNTAFGTARACGIRYRGIYRAISIAMAITLVAAVAAHLLLDTFSYAGLIAEIALIAEFTAYWVVQIIEDGHADVPAAVPRIVVNHVTPQ